MWVSLTAAGSVSDYDAAWVATFTATMDGLSGGSGTATVTAASVIITYHVSGLSSPQRDAAVAALDPILASPATASSYLGISVEAVNTYEVVTYSTSPPAAPPSSGGMVLVIVGAVVGGAVVLLLIVSSIYFRRLRSRTKVTAAEVIESQHGTEQTPVTPLT